MALAGVAEGSAGAPRVCETCNAWTDCLRLTLLSRSLLESWDVPARGCDPFSADGWFPILTTSNAGREIVQDVARPGSLELRAGDGSVRLP